MKAIFYPKLRPSLLLPILSYAAIGALIAGLYGVVHDQITYSISPEYFTRLKFFQFHYADFGLPPRYFVAEIGFLATWWVGFIAGWFLGRVAVPESTAAAARSRCLRGFTVILAFGFAASLVGFGLGLLLDSSADFSGWQLFASQHGVTDLRSFVRVAYIHNTSYLGGLIGLVIALVDLHRLKKQANKSPGSESALAP